MLIPMTPSTPVTSEDRHIHSIGHGSFSDAPIHHNSFAMPLVPAFIGVVCSMASSEDRYGFLKRLMFSPSLNLAKEFIYWFQFPAHPSELDDVDKENFYVLTSSVSAPRLALFWSFGIGFLGCDQSSLFCWCQHSSRTPDMPVYRLLS